MNQNVRVCHLGRKGKDNKEKVQFSQNIPRNVLIQLPMGFYKKL